MFYVRCDCLRLQVQHPRRASSSTLPAQGTANIENLRMPRERAYSPYSCWRTPPLAHCRHSQTAGSASMKVELNHLALAAAVNEPELGAHHG